MTTNLNILSVEAMTTKALVARQLGVNFDAFYATLTNAGHQSYQPEDAVLWTKDEVQQVWDTAFTQDELYAYHCKEWEEFATEQWEMLKEEDVDMGDVEDYIQDHAEVFIGEWKDQTSLSNNAPWNMVVYSAAVYLGEIPKGAISNRIISHGTKSWDDGNEYLLDVDMLEVMEYVLGNKSLSQAVEDVFVDRLDPLEEDGTLDLIKSMTNDDEEQIKFLSSFIVAYIYKELAHLFEAFILIYGEEGEVLDTLMDNFHAFAVRVAFNYIEDEDDDEQPEGLVALIKEGEEDDEWNSDGDYEEYGIRKIYFWAYTPKGLDFGDEFIHDDEWVEGADDSFVRTNYWLWYDENHDLTDDQTQLMARANLPEGYDWDWGFDD